MPTITIALIALGLVLLFAGGWIARAVMRDRDSIALARILQASGIVVIVVALLTWPRAPESTAFPPPQEGPPSARQ